jgi:acyl transferase domain-containing protein/acyl carrier protein
MKQSGTPSEAVAIIGLAGRFPGARNVEEFWRNLRAGVESIRFFDEKELEASGIGPEIYTRPDYVRAKGLCDDVEMFDAGFFGLTPREAEIMDPQHRLFLECSWEALESAGYDFEEWGGRIGVYAGSSMSTYLLVNLLSNPELFERVNGLQARIMNDRDFLTTHVSYKLNLEGPSIAVQTACSTSLVAVHLAAQALLDGECDMALAGGVTLRFPYKVGYLYQEGGIWSLDGHCRAFDAEARGTVEGNGAGVVVLKRLSDALADADFIHAVIKGSAINNDGARKAGYTTPSAESQARVVTEALALAGVEPETISCVEAHGSGTPLGDTIEVTSLIKAFRTERKNFCALGSVKTNIGHMDNAAGVAGLIKMIQALKHKLLPPSLNFKETPPQLSLAQSPFYVNTTLAEWRAGDTPRRAGVSSLGIGGTNAHVVLEETPARAESGPSRPWQLLLLSAKSDAALATMTTNLTEHLKQNPDLKAADVAYTLQVGRRRFTHRRALVCRDTEDAVKALTAGDVRRVLTGVGESGAPGVVFMFPGLGDHYAGMAAGLYHAEPTFRAHVDRCAELLKPHLNLDLRDLVCQHQPVGAGPGGNGDGAAAAPRHPDLRKLFAPAPEDEVTRKLNLTYLAQPTVFVIEYALARLLMSWGVSPQAMIGYSIGEYVAACLAGVFSLETALALVADRARMIQELPGGAMLAIPLPDAEVCPLLDHRLSLAACDGPLLSVVGGTHEAVDALARELENRDIACLRLSSTHAFHSQMMEPITSRFVRRVSEVALMPPRIPFVSNFTGTWITAEQATDPNYWACHMRHTVRFAEGLGELLREPQRIMLEVGPGQTLGTLVRQHPAVRADHLILASLRGRHDEVSDEFFLLHTVGRLWLAGCRLDWRGFYAHERRGRVPLPSYPFERRRYWIEPGSAGASAALRVASAPKSGLADWFYRPVWKQSCDPGPPAETLSADGSNWLIFLDELGNGARLAEELARGGCAVVCVEAGEGFAVRGENLYAVNPQQRHDYNSLVRALIDRQLVPHRVAHMWSVTASDGVTAAAREFDGQLQVLGYSSLLLFAQALGEQGVTAPMRLDVISNHLYGVTGDEPLCAQKATLRGACKVIPQEYQNLTCRSIDIVTPAADTPADGRTIEQLVRELTSPSVDQLVAYRGRRRWVVDYEAARLERSPGAPPRLREGGSYLVTGGLEEAGIVIAEHLARTARAQLTLVAEPEFPPQDKWEQWLSAHDDDEPVSRRIRRLHALEASGSRVLFFIADVTNEEQMRVVVARTCARFGKIDGVIHAAAGAGAGIIQLKTPEMISAALTLKLKGTLVLASATDDLALDFFALFSSITSIAGGFGQADLCAASAFLDAFAQQRALSDKGFTASINWGLFQWDDWHLSAPGDLAMQSQLSETLQTYGIGAQECQEAFDRILTANSPQVIVSPRRLRSVMEQTDKLTAANLLATLRQTNAAGGHRRPELATAYVAPRNEVERAVAAVWQDSFGIEQVGVWDNFFELAGNSLLAIQIVTRLRNNFQVKLPMTALFESPTVAELAARVEEALRPASEADELERMLREIESLSPEEAERRLAEELGAGE